MERNKLVYTDRHEYTEITHHPIDYLYLYLMCDLILTPYWITVNLHSLNIKKRGGQLNI